MQTVTNTEGHEVRVVDESDLLRAERSMRRWLGGLIVTVASAALYVGVTWATTVRQVEANRQRIEEVRSEGSVPVRQIKEDLATIKEQQRQNSIILERLDARLDEGR